MLPLQGRNVDRPDVPYSVAGDGRYSALGSSEKSPSVGVDLARFFPFVLVVARCEPLRSSSLPTFMVSPFFLFRSRLEATRFLALTGSSTNVLMYGASRRC